MCHRMAVCTTTNAAVNARRQREQTGTAVRASHGCPIESNTCLSPREYRHPASKGPASSLSYKASPAGCCRRSYPTVPTLCKRPETYHSESGSHVAALSSLRFSFHLAGVKHFQHGMREGISWVCRQSSYGRCN